MTPDTRETARFYDALAGGALARGLWGLERRFDAAKIVRSPSVDAHFRRVVAPYLAGAPRVLDVGCGPGGFTAVLAGMAGHVVGLDVSPGWVARATENFRALGVAARAVLGDGERLPFPEGSFDVVVLVDVLHHLDEPARVLEETQRVLSSRGRLLVFEPNRWNPALTALCLLDRNEWGFLRPGMGTLAGYRRMLAPWFEVDRAEPSGLLIGPDGPWARQVADAVTQGPLAPALGWLAPKVFLAARRWG